VSLKIKEIGMGNIMFILVLTFITGIIFYKKNLIKRWYEENFGSYIGIILALGGLSLLWGLVIVFSFAMIKPGEVGVVVNLLGREQGVSDKELNVGIHFIWPWEKLYEFPIFEQNHQWVGDEGFSFQTSEGLSVQTDIGITFNLEPAKIHTLFYKYRRGMDEITHLFIRNNIRDAINRTASKMKIEELYGPKKEEFFETVHAISKSELEDLGFNISHLYIIGQFKVPELVMEALNKKIEATQRAQQRENELREAEAQAKKGVAIVEGEARAKLIKAQADAKSNEMISKSLTAELLEWEAINKWDGKLPEAMLGNNTPFLMQLKEKK
jgi:regulator of protease activity HflC (stomatin/prohibitin superfamily)